MPRIPAPTTLHIEIQTELKRALLLALLKEEKSVINVSMFDPSDTTLRKGHTT